jgi:antitoxin component YwqK of YwqJK toxin-antitoxin module
MKQLSIFLISIILFSCSTEVKRYSFEDTISKNQLVYLENDMSLVNGIVYLKNLNNTLNKEITYIDGKKEGLESSYYENGQLKYEGNYLNYENYLIKPDINSGERKSQTKKDGVWKMYDEKGIIRILQVWENGLPITEECFDNYGNKIKCVN